MKLGRTMLAAVASLVALLLLTVITLRYFSDPLDTRTRVTTRR